VNLSGIGFAETVLQSIERQIEQETETHFSTCMKKRTFRRIYFLIAGAHRTANSLIATMRLAIAMGSDYTEAFNRNKSNSSLFPLKLKSLSLAVFLLLLVTPVFSQQDTAQLTTVDSLKIRHDSTVNKFFSSIKQFGADAQRKNITEYTEGVIARRQDDLIGQIRTLTLEAKSYLENGLDTTGLSTELNKIEGWYDITSDGVFVKAGTIQTHRNLETSFKILRELLTRTLARKSSLDNYYLQLSGFKNKIDSLYKDSVLYTFSSDSTVLMRYVKKLIVVSQEIKPTDSALNKALTTVPELQSTLNQLVTKLNTSIEQIAIFQEQLSAKTFTRETTNLGDTVRYSRRFNEIIYFSFRKGALALIFYTENQSGKLFLLLIFFIIVTVFLTSLKRKLRTQNMLNDDMQREVVLKHPALSAVVIVLNLFQFMFVDPPFIFNALLWTISGICLSFVIRHSVTRYWMSAWAVLFVFFLLACLDNLILQASRPERWVLLGLSAAGIVSSSILIFRGRRQELKEGLVIYFIGFVIVLQIISIISNVYGRYNLSKTCFTSGFFNVVLAMLFFGMLRLINQSLALASKAHSVPGKKLFNINFERVGSKASPVFYMLLFVGWFILFARNFYVFKLIANPIKNLIVDNRTIGNVSFTIGNIFEFFMILYLAGLASRIVSFFATGTPGQYNRDTRKGGIGSWLLIIRIAIFSIALLLAFATIGIPMDRLTIILSALSVGVGFGLQSLVNNLVSGLIISFEKPVKIGDIVEIGEQSGTIKSIGFRSSILSTLSGSDVVIPNGELLNQHLVNWTHDNSLRRVDIPLGVAYGTNLQKAIQILKDLPTKDERVLLSPPPWVTLRQFGESSIDMQLSFWAKNIREWIVVKSDIILAIDSAFKENKIEIPLPQQDIHIRSISQEEIISTVATISK